MVEQIEKIPEKEMQTTKKRRFLNDIAEVVEKGWKYAELHPAEGDFNPKYVSNTTQLYRWAARHHSQHGIVVRVVMKRDAEKNPHWYTEVIRMGDRKDADD